MGGLISPTEIITSGGPAGSDDAFLRLSTATFHLGTRNTNQWTGNYAAVGVNCIEMDLKQLDDGEDHLEIRIIVWGPGGMFATKARTTHLARNQWQHYSFSLRPEHMVHVSGGTGVLADTLSQVERLQIRHDFETPTLPSQHPPHVTAEIGLDNIQARVGPLKLRQPIIDSGPTLSETSNNIVAGFSFSNLHSGRTYVLERSLDLNSDFWEQRLKFQSRGNTDSAWDTISDNPSILIYRVR